MTLIVLAVTSVQIFLARPRASPPVPHEGVGAGQPLVVRGGESTTGLEQEPSGSG